MVITFNVSGPTEPKQSENGFKIKMKIVFFSFKKVSNEPTDQLNYHYSFLEVKFENTNFKFFKAIISKFLIFLTLKFVKFPLETLK